MCRGEDGERVMDPHRGREREREREVSRDGGVIFLLVDERFSSPHTSSAGDSASALQSISMAVFLSSSISHMHYKIEAVKSC